MFDLKMWYLIWHRINMSRNIGDWGVCFIIVVKYEGVHQQKDHNWVSQYSYNKVNQSQHTISYYCDDM
ncbi:hypothetical protein D3C80_1859760 [compost metagenome]